MLPRLGLLICLFLDVGAVLVHQGPSNVGAPSTGLVEVLFGRVYDMSDIMLPDGSHFSCPEHCGPEDGSRGGHTACFEAEDDSFTEGGRMHCGREDDSPRCGCHVRCVQATLCGLAPLKPNRNISDATDKHCSDCRVSNCKTCSRESSSECLECHDRYTLAEGGCIGIETYVVYGIVGCIMLLVFTFFIWYLELRCRPAENLDGLQEGLHHRDLVMVGQEHGILEMNLLQNPIGGAGSVLFFRYHLGTVMWGACLFCVWLFFLGHQEDFLEYAGHNHTTSHSAANEEVMLGVPPSALVLRGGGAGARGARLSPRQGLYVGSPLVRTTSDVCWLVEYTFVVQQEAMDAQLYFTVGAWALTFIFFVFFSFKQFWKFLHLDNGSQMSDYCLICDGLPQMSGDDVENDLFTFFSQEFGTASVVGVSVCWDFQEEAEAVRDAIDADTYDSMMQSDRKHKKAVTLEMGAVSALSRPSAAAREPLARPSRSDARTVQSVKKGDVGLTKARAFVRIMDAAMGFKQPKKKDPKVLWKKAVTKVKILVRLGGKNFGSPITGISQVLRDMKCSGSAFVILNREDARDRAVQAKGVRYEGNLLVFKALKVEPETVNWGNFHIEPPSAFRIRVVKGLVFMVVLLTLYAVGFYRPYYQIMVNTDFSNVPTPYTIAYFTQFFIANFGTVVVVLGNQIVYYASGSVADYMGFLFEDSAQTVYVALYNVAVLTQTVIDLTINYFISWNSLKQLGYRTHDGRLFDDNMSFAERITDITVQAAVGHGFYKYCFPACFLIPFMIEPIAVYFMPYHLQKCLVAAHPWVRGHVAEQKLDFLSPMDLSRYGDIMLNVTLVTLGFIILPADLFQSLLGWFVVCHFYLFCYDYYRILRLVPGFCISNNLVYRAVEYFMVLPTSILAAAIVCRLNMNKHIDAEQTAANLPVVMMACAFAANAVLFWLFVGVPGTDYGLVPFIVNRAHQHEDAEEDFQTYAATTPASWFTTNPVHCLRTKYLHGHKPSCGYFVRGKEELLRYNPKANAYYGADRTSAAEREEWASQPSLWE